MLALIPLFPFLGFVVNSTLGKRLSKNVSGGLASFVMLASFGVSAMSVWRLAGMEPAQRSGADPLHLDRLGRFLGGRGVPPRSAVFVAT